jgi:hypothetical protein
LEDGYVTQGESKPSCAKCRHYFITHDARFPYGCRAMNFKSQGSPHNEIVAATGAACVTFEPRSENRRR